MEVPSLDGPPGAQIAGQGKEKNNVRLGLFNMEQPNIQRQTQQVFGNVNKLSTLLRLSKQASANSQKVRNNVEAECMLSGPLLQTHHVGSHMDANAAAAASHSHAIDGICTLEGMQETLCGTEIRTTLVG